MRDDYAKRVIEVYERRFWRRVRKDGPNGCWLWTGHLSPKGYGAFKDAGSSIVPAHRAAYDMEVGSIPEGHVVMHRCDNPPCVNPAHLTTGTIADNNADRDAKGRAVHAKGSKHWAARISEETVRAIRATATSGVQQADIARTFGLTPQTVYSIVKRRSWKHIE